MRCSNDHIYSRNSSARPSNVADRVRLMIGGAFLAVAFWAISHGNLQSCCFFACYAELNIVTLMRWKRAWFLPMCR
jgi:hypothetical protein